MVNLPVRLALAALHLQLGLDGVITLVRVKDSGMPGVLPHWQVDAEALEQGPPALGSRCRQQGTLPPAPPAPQARESCPRALACRAGDCGTRITWRVVRRPRRGRVGPAVPGLSAVLSDLCAVGARYGPFLPNHVDSGIPPVTALNLT